MKNFTKILFAFLLIIISNQVLKAQTVTPYYEGTINGNLKIQMYLKYKGEQKTGSGLTTYFYTGWYYYEDQGSQNQRTLTGTYFSSMLNLTEEYKGQMTGGFELMENRNGGFEGTWTDASGNRTLPVLLKPKK